MNTSKLSSTIYSFFAFLFFVLLSTVAFADDSTKGYIKGSVQDPAGKPVENASVALKGTSYGTITDEQGKFRLHFPVGSYTLVVTHVGIKSQEIPVTIEANKTLTLPAITINTSVASLQQVNISANKTNKFKIKKSDDVARMPLNNLENPQSYTSVSKEILQEQAIFTADNAIQNAPGITKLWTATDRVGDGGSYYTLRGFSTQALLRNGLTGNVTSTIDAANLEKLEVIKGPSATLFGSELTSFGGLINRVTKKPFDNTAGEISYSYGSYNFNRVSVDYNTPIDTSKKALLRINSAYNDQGSFQDNGALKSFVFDPSFSYKVNDRLTLSFDAEIMHEKTSTPSIFYFSSPVASLGVTSADKLSLDYRRSYQNGDIFETADNVNIFAQADYKLSDSWRSQTAISSTSSTSSGYQPYFYLLPGNHSIARNVWNVGGNANTFQLQQNFIGDFKIAGLRNRLVAGADFLNQSENITYSDPSEGTDAFDTVSTRGAIPTYASFSKAKVDALFANTDVSYFYARNNTYTTSAYASDVLNITNNLLAMASLRLDYYDARPISDPSSGTVTKGMTQTTLSPKFGLVYQVVKDQVSLFGNHQNGFVHPGYANFYDAATGTLASRLAKTEQANQWEGGVKLDLFNGRLSSTISYYDISVSNILTSDPAHANASLQNGTQYSKGIEAEVLANPFDGFNIDAGYSHNDSKENGLRPETAGPANSANLWLSYTIAHGNAKGLGIGFGGNYASNNVIINDSYYGVFTLPSYTLLNTGIFYNKERLRLALNVNNLTNKEYWIGYTTVDPQMLRQIIGSVTFKF